MCIRLLPWLRTNGTIWTMEIVSIIQRRCRRRRRPFISSIKIKKRPYHNTTEWQQDNSNLILGNDASTSGHRCFSVVSCSNVFSLVHHHIVDVMIILYRLHWYGMLIFKSVSRPHPQIQKPQNIYLFHRNWSKISPKTHFSLLDHFSSPQWWCPGSIP